MVELSLFEGMEGSVAVLSDYFFWWGKETETVRIIMYSGTMALLSKKSVKAPPGREELLLTSSPISFR